MLEFQTSAQLKQANLLPGDVIRLLADQSGDGRSRVMIVQTPAQFNGTPDEINDFELANSNIAKTLEGQTRYEPQFNNLTGTPVMRVDNRANSAAVAVRQGTSGVLDLSPRLPRLTDGILSFWFEGVNQTTSGFGSDTMWRNENSGSTKVHTQETLTLDQDIPQVPEARFYSRTVVTSVAGAGNFVRKTQRIEDVRTYAGQVVTISFFARADTVKNISVELVQNFGSGGGASPPVTGIGAQTVQLSTTFARYEIAILVPAINGKTIESNSVLEEQDYLEVRFWFDAGSNFNANTGSLGQQSGTFDLACIQDDLGEAAKQFYVWSQKEATDRLNRYFKQNTPEGLTLAEQLHGFLFGTTQGAFLEHHKPPMRRNPTVTFGPTASFSMQNAEATNVLNNIADNGSDRFTSQILAVTATPFTTANLPVSLFVTNNNAIQRYDARL